MLDINDLIGLFEDIDDANIVRVNIELESLTEMKVHITVGDEEEASADPEEEAPDQTLQEEEKPEKEEKNPEEKKLTITNAEINRGIDEAVPKRKAGRPKKSTDQILDEMARKRGEL